MAWVPKPPTEIFWCDRCGALEKQEGRHEDGWDAHFTCMGPMIKLKAEPAGPDATTQWAVAYRRWIKEQKTEPPRPRDTKGPAG